MKKIAENIKSLRERDKLTQGQLASLLNVHEKYVSAMERGVNDPSPHLVEKLCNAFSVDELHLRFGDRDENGLDRRHSQHIRRLVEITTPLSESEQCLLLGQAIRWIKENGQ